MSPNSILIVLMHRGLRVSDNPYFDYISTTPGHGFTHLLPLYTFAPNQIEVSGFIKDGSKCPYPEARSSVGGYWRCGPHRAKFIAESVWDVKNSLESLGSGLVIRVGMPLDVIRDAIQGLKAEDQAVGGVWMVSHEGVEEKRDEKAVAALCEEEGVAFKLWADEKYFIDDRDVGIKNPQDLPDVFTTYRKSVEPLREKPRAVLPTPEQGSLPPLPEVSSIPGQQPPFVIPQSLDELSDAMVSPVKSFLHPLPEFPESAESAHPFRGGETAARERLMHLIKSEGMKNYKNTRNRLVGTEFSTKLSAYLAQGCVTARQIHHALVGYEDGTDDTFKNVDGFGAGENEGTAAIRFELLWRDYMRLCHQKFKAKLFRLEGFKSDEDYKDGDKKPKWKFPTKERAGEDQDPSPERVAVILERFNAGTTGMGLIDASQRELLHTGYTSNRARQNVASFLAKHLLIDWRYGAEWYEMLLVDYDVSSNWANWAYVSGVGNDPRGDLRIFNPIKQAFDYDAEGTYVRSWVPEVSKLKNKENVFQACTAPEEDLRVAGLEGNIMVTDPVKRIEYLVDAKPSRLNKRAFFRRKAQKNQVAGSESVASSEGNPASGAADDGQLGLSGQVSPATGDNFLAPIAPAQRCGSDGGRGGHPRGGRGGGGYRGGHRGGYRGRHNGYYHGGRGAGRGRGRGGFTTSHAGQGQQPQWEQQASPPQTDA